MTPYHMFVLWGTEWLLNFEWHCLTIYQHFRSTCAQGLKILYTTTVIPGQNIVQPYDIALFQIPDAQFLLKKLDAHFLNSPIFSW